MPLPSFLSDLLEKKETIGANVDRFGLPARRRGRATRFARVHFVENVIHHRRRRRTGGEEESIVSLGSQETSDLLFVVEGDGPFRRLERLGKGLHGNIVEMLFRHGDLNERRVDEETKSRRRVPG